MKFSWPALRVAALMLLCPSIAAASGTRLWELAGFEELQKGELKGTVLSSVGEVQLGLTAEKGELPEGVGAVWSAARSGVGDLYLGTGYDGKIFRVKNRKATHVADTGQLVVTAMTFDKKGDLFVAALPDSVIWRIRSPKRIASGKPVTAEKWATLPEDTEHVWTLTFSADGRTLFVGTGPEGKIFAVGPDAKPKLYLDTEEEHILSSVLDAKGRLTVGTSPSAVIFRIDGPGRSTALADFDDVEVKALATYKDRIYAAVNDFKTPPSVPKKSTSTSNSESSSSTSKTEKTAVGDGALYRIDADGRQEKLWSEKKEHIVSLAAASTGTVFVGLGVDGKVISVDEKREVRHELDLEERQVMVLLADKTLTFAGCGDSGAMYDVGSARNAEAVYLTPLLDSEVVSEWGRLSWFADGKLKLQARSGNTVTPDTAWSDWSKPLAQKDIIPSPPGRYLQFRLSWADDAKAVFTSLQAAMKSANQRALITEFDSGSQFPKPAGSADDTVSDRIAEAKPDPKIDPELSLSWKVKNPDGDDMRYRLWYRKMGEKLWRPMFREDQVLTALRFTWKTDAVPEGFYQIKLTADDSRANADRDVTEDTYVSPPVLVDNQPPTIRKLRIQNGTVSGIAADSFSDIGAIEYSADNGPWSPVMCLDRIFDEPEEAFSFSLPSDLGPGPHAIAVRAYDRGGNTGVGELLIELK